MTGEARAHRAPRRWAVWVALLVPAVLITVVAVGSVVGNRARANVLHPQGPPPAGAVVADTFRQGWGFFTRDAREDRIDLFIDIDGQWQRSSAGIMATADHLFGANRTQRAYMADVAYLSAELEEDAWEGCAGGPNQEALETCSSTASETVISARPIAQIPCDERVIVTKERTIPFAYAGLTDQRQLEVQVIRIDCD